jgi:sulfatase modifying factor 1
MQMSILGMPASYLFSHPALYHTLTKTAIEYPRYRSENLVEIPVFARITADRVSGLLTFHIASSSMVLRLVIVSLPVHSSREVPTGFLFSHRDPEEIPVHGGEEMRRASALAAVVALLCLGGTAQATITIDTVAVGNAGNAPDTTGYGRVAYTFHIGKYEVTAGQYAAFLNAVAKTDTYGLYNSNMWSSSYGCKIQQSGVSGNYTYSVQADWANGHVNYVSYWDACRFANWLHNGQGEGGSESGAYTMAANGGTYDAVTRNGIWTWAVASEDEWYKAAYYRNYAPTYQYSEFGGGLVLNENIPSGWPSPSEESPIGPTLWEWNEALPPCTSCGLRGASAYDGGGYRPKWFRASLHPTHEDYYIGFRVVQAVPEPSSIVILACGMVSLMGLRRRRA